MFSNLTEWVHLPVNPSFQLDLCQKINNFRDPTGDCELAIGSATALVEVRCRPLTRNRLGGGGRIVPPLSFSGTTPEP